MQIRMPSILEELDGEEVFGHCMHVFACVKKILGAVRIYRHFT